MMKPEDPSAAAEIDVDACKADIVGATKRTYVRPQLTVLGSVRELTLGAAGSADDGAFALQRR